MTDREEKIEIVKNILSKYTVTDVDMAENIISALEKYDIKNWIERVEKARSHKLNCVSKTTMLPVSYGQMNFSDD